MIRKRKKSTRADFLRACQKNGVVFKKSNEKTVKRDYIEVIDDDGSLVKLTKDFNLFYNPYRLEEAFSFTDNYTVSYDIDSLSCAGEEVVKIKDITPDSNFKIANFILSYDLSCNHKKKEYQTGVCLTPAA